jgi:hypothetical protein
VAAGAGLGADLVVLDADAAIVVAHGERENAAASRTGREGELTCRSR